MTATTKAEYNRRMEISNDLGMHSLNRIGVVLKDQMDLCSTQFQRMRVMMMVTNHLLKELDHYFLGNLKGAMGRDFQADPNMRFQMLASAIHSMAQPEPPKNKDLRLTVAAYLAAFCLKYPKDPDLGYIAGTIADMVGGQEMIDELQALLREKAAQK